MNWTADSVIVKPSLLMTLKRTVTVISNRVYNQLTPPWSMTGKKISSSEALSSKPLQEGIARV
jgi:hypothetical protein